MTIDVCLVVEGSYPYITGGVASWVHQVVSNLPDVKFGLVTLLPDEKFARVDKYAVPPNVVYRQDVFLFGEHPDDGKRREPSRAMMQALTHLHQAGGIRPEDFSGERDLDVDRCPFVRAIEGAWRAGNHSAGSMMTARASWHFMRALYQQRQRRVSFLDYFWTWRAIHGPMFRLFDCELPAAKVYHPVSTGYAGLLACLGKLRHGAGVVLTEHGLYTREREIEITGATWIYREPSQGTSYTPHEPFFKGWWRSQYRFLGRLTYDMADTIVTLHERNRRAQIEAGAPDAKLVVVPNGVRPEKFAAARTARDWSARPFQVALIGRVVPIKDVKTFLRAIQHVHLAMPGRVEAYVLGPTDEDPAYLAECEQLVAMLDVPVTFPGRVNLAEWLGKLDLNVLTSVSESQPLVILEAWAAGVPSVATDVGACKEMLLGRNGPDRLLGPAGIVTPVASPRATGEAIMALLANPTKHAEMAAAGIARVTKHYHEADVFAYYAKLYADLGRAATVAT